MRNKLDKKNLIIYLKYQLNSALSVSLRSISIYIFTDLMSYSYSFVFWLSFFIVSLNSFFIQKKFVFKSSNKKSLDKFIFVAMFLGTLEYFFSILLLDYFQLNVIPFLIVGFLIYVVRFLLNRNYVFKND
jgi:putative flippase GtrA